VLANIRLHYADVPIAIVSLNHMSQSSIRSAAKEIASLADRLDLIIKNAGFMT
jgi:NADP-dependent 3-hydroxy acid dehydrogenase YdfG